MQYMKGSLWLSKSEKMIGKTHGTICVDLSVYIDYSQIQTEAEQKRDKPWLCTSRNSRAIEVSVDDFLVGKRAFARVVVKQVCWTNDYLDKWFLLLA